MEFIFYYDDVPSMHYTGVIHRGVCVLGMEIRLQPEQDRAIGLIVFNRWCGWAAPPKK